MNWSKYILLLLPPRLRFIRLHAFLTVLLSPVVSLYDQFRSWQARKKMQLSATPQAIWLPKIVWEEMGAKIGIEYSDGIPDFWVIVYDDNADIPRLRTLIERYKLAGKSYRIKLQDETITQEWIDFVCTSFEYRSFFNAFVCVDSGLINNYIAITAGIVGLRGIMALLTYPAESEINISLTYQYSSGLLNTINLLVAEQERSSTYELSPTEPDIASIVQAEILYPEGGVDNKYKYIIDIS